MRRSKPVKPLGQLLQRFPPRKGNDVPPQPSYPTLQNPPIRLVNPNGKANVVRLGLPQTPGRDLYHLLLTIPWIGFLSLISLLYIAINVVFACLYLAGGDGIANAQPGSFGDAFFFSVQTMASIGYGAMHPKTTYTNLIVTLESLVGLLWIAMATGLMFARFSRPTARVLFSNVAVILPRNGVLTLMFRTANRRQNQIFDAQMQLTLVRNEWDEEGKLMRRFYDLKLVRSQTPIFFLTWTAMHLIEPSSPLYGITAETLAEMEAELIVTVTGFDETFSQTIHARHSFIANEIFWNMRLVDILARTDDGKRVVDFSRFHSVEPLPEQNP